jgi:hypothetical protein
MWTIALQTRPAEGTQGPEASEQSTGAVMDVRFGGKADMSWCSGPKRTSSNGVASAFGTIFAVFPSCNTSATLDAIRRDVAPTRPANSCFCASQICTIPSVQGVAASSDPFAFRGCRRAFELA